MNIFSYKKFKILYTFLHFLINMLKIRYLYNV